MIMVYFNYGKIIHGGRGDFNFFLKLTLSSPLHIFQLCENLSKIMIILKYSSTLIEQ